MCYYYYKHGVYKSCPTSCPKKKETRKYQESVKTPQHDTGVLPDIPQGRVAPQNQGTLRNISQKLRKKAPEGEILEPFFVPYLTQTLRTTTPPPLPLPSRTLNGTYKYLRQLRGTSFIVPTLSICCNIEQMEGSDLSLQGGPFKNLQKFFQEYQQCM